jgi:hypothetical protein
MSNSVVIDFYDIKNNKSLLKELIRQKKSQRYSSSQLNQNIKEFNQAKEEIKRKFIESDKTENNSLTYAAMTSFKNTNE